MFAHVHASLTLHFPGCSVLLRDPHHQKMDGDRVGGSKENKDTTSPATKIGFWGGLPKMLCADSNLDGLFGPSSKLGCSLVYALGLLGTKPWAPALKSYL